MNRKTIIALGVGTCLSLTLAGCGDKQAATDGSDASGGQPPVLGLTSPSPAASTTTVGSSAMGATSGDIVQTVLNDPRFSTLGRAIEAAGLAQTLKGAGPHTIFAPTNEAFNKLPAGTLENLLRPENKGRLASLLRNHVLPSRVMADDIRALDNGTAVKTLGETLRVKRQGDSVRVDDAQVVQADIRASNGVIHVIDTVLLPGEADPTSGAAAGGSARYGGGAPSGGAGSAATAGGPVAPSGPAPNRTRVPTAGGGGYAAPGTGGGYGTPAPNGAGRVPGRAAGTGSGIGATSSGGTSAGMGTAPSSGAPGGGSTASGAASGGY